MYLRDDLKDFKRVSKDARGLNYVLCRNFMIPFANQLNDIVAVSRISFNVCVDVQLVLKLCKRGSTKRMCFMKFLIKANVS